jgi:hypothetical protein
MSWARITEGNQREEMGVEGGADGSDARALDVRGKWGGGRQLFQRNRRRLGKRDLTGGVRLAGRERGGRRGFSPGLSRWAFGSGPAQLGWFPFFVLLFFSIFLFPVLLFELAKLI